VARSRALLLTTLLLSALGSCSQARDVFVSNGCSDPVDLSFFGGIRPPTDWEPYTTIPARTEQLLESALAGTSGDVGIVSIRYPDGSSRVSRIGGQPGNPVVLNLQGVLCSA
jgi:hypothetical protein